MRILGVDPGSAVTGYGLIAGDVRTSRALDYGVLRPPPAAPLAEKLLVVYRGLLEIFERHRPDCAAVESLFHAKNARSALALGHVRGVVLLAAAESGVPTFEYAPMEIKKALVGYGRAEKEQVQMMVTRLLSLPSPPRPLDAADALAVALCHAAVASFQSRLERAE
ncbi:MAG TPA: crossover junction endodeoxyribonuclease RuvC [Acidobacteriota bacterium]